jgi:hypothetical protein
MRINSVQEIPRVRVKEIPEVRCLFGANWQAKMCRWASRHTVLLLAMASGIIPSSKGAKTKYHS